MCGDDVNDDKMISFMFSLTLIVLAFRCMSYSVTTYSNNVNKTKYCVLGSKVNE